VLEASLEFANELLKKVNDENREGILLRFSPLCSSVDLMEKNDVE